MRIKVIGPGYTVGPDRYNPGTYLLYVFDFDDWIHLVDRSELADAMEGVRRCERETPIVPLWKIVGGRN